MLRNALEVRAPISVGALVAFCILLSAGQPSWSEVGVRDRAPASDGGAPLTQCRRIAGAADPAIEARISTYFEHDNLQPDILRLDIAKVPDGFFDDPRTSMQLIAWKETAGGERATKTPALRLFFISKTSGVVLRRTPIDRINSNTIDAAIGMGHLDETQLSHKNFLRLHAVQMTGLGKEWEGVTLNVYEGGVVVMSFEALLPRRSGNEMVSTRAVDILCR